MSYKFENLLLIARNGAMKDHSKIEKSMNKDKMFTKQALLTLLR